MVTEYMIYYKLDNKKDFYIVRWLQKPKKKILVQYLKDVNGSSFKLGISKKIVDDVNELYLQYKCDCYDDEGCILKISSKLSLPKTMINLMVNKK